MKGILNIPELTNKFSKHFKLVGHSPISEMQQTALAYFEETGFPSTKNEDWKYTNAEPLLKKNFSIATKKDETDTLLAEKIKSFIIPELDCYQLVFVNGFYNASLSNVPAASNDITIAHFSEALNKRPDLIKKHFGHHSNYKTDGFTAVNMALATDGAFVFVNDKAVVAKPIHALFIADNTHEHTFIQPRNLIVVGKQAQATIIESHHAIGKDFSLTNLVSEIVLDEAAQVDYYVIQHLASEETNEASIVNTTQAILAKNSRFNIFTSCLSGAFIRNSLNVLLNGTGVETHLFGLYLPNGKEFMDNHSLVDHAAPNCFSNEYYKGVMNNQSKAVFNGKIVVRKDSQKTNAYQSNKNILLSDEATINTKPQLEIFADDVKCSHGATSGQLDEEALFYLKARGIGDASARAMLTLAFAEDVISNIKLEPIRLQLEKWIEERLIKYP